MSVFVRQAAAQLLPHNAPIKQFQRFRGKINIQRPQKPHYDRARMLLATEPVFPEPEKTKNCFVPNPAIQTKLETVNPYNDIIAREVRNWLDHSRMVAIFHVNSINADDIFKVRVQLHRQNMHLKSYGKKIISKAVNGTRYEAILPLFDSNHCIVFSTEQNVNKLLRITKKVPQMVLLAGIVDNRLLSRNEFMDYARLPNLQMAQAELVQTLNMAAGNLVQQLEAHQNNFVNVLDVYVKESSANTPNPATTTETSNTDSSKTAE